MGPDRALKRAGFNGARGALTLILCYLFSEKALTLGGDAFTAILTG